MSTDSQIEYYPLDFDALSKGDIIAREKVEQIGGLPCTHPRFSLKAMGLKELIECECANRGKAIVCRIEHGAIYLLEDPEAAEYLAQQSRLALRKLVRSHRKALTVDVGKLDSDQRKKHERNVEVQGRYLQAIAKVRAELKLTGHVRQTPGLPAPHDYEQVGAE